MTPRRTWLPGLLVLIPLLTMLARPVLAQTGGTVERVSIATDGTQGNNPSEAPAISVDGRYVAFASTASTLVVGDTNGWDDVFVHDRLTGVTERVSVASDGTQGDLRSYDPAISADGRYVAFSSYATTLVAGDANGTWDIFVHDRQTGATTLVSVATDGTQGNHGSTRPAISADGAIVAFQSDANTLVSGDTNASTDIFIRDRTVGTTTRVSVATGGGEGSSYSILPDISADGQVVAFQSDAGDLVVGDTNGDLDIFVRDLNAATTTRVSVATGGAEGDGHSREPKISGDGGRVLFHSDAPDLVAGDTNAGTDVFVRDLDAATTTRVSVASDGAQALDDSFGGDISGDGDVVAFGSWAANLVAGDTNGLRDVFLRNLDAGTTTRISVDAAGQQGLGNSFGSALSYDGRFVAFESEASNLVAGDTNGHQDIFVRDGTPPLSGWDYDVDISGDPGATEQLFPDLAVGPDGTLAAVWEDYRDGIYRKNGDVYAGVSTDGGATWSGAMRVNDDAAGAAGRRNPRVAVAGNGDVYVVWEDWRNDPDPENPYATGGDLQNPDIYFAKLPAGGATFGANVKVYDDADVQYAPDIAVDGDGTIYVAWYDRTGDVYYGNSVVAKSTDGGASFGAPVTAENHSKWALTPRLAVDQGSGTVYLVYQGHPYIPGEGSYYKPFFTRSTDGGATWSTDVQLDAGPDREWYDAAREIVVAGDDAGHVVVMWSDERHDPNNGYSGSPDYHDEFDIYANISSDGGSTWLTTTNVLVNDDSTFDQIRYPSVAFEADGTVRAVWQDGRVGDGKYHTWSATSSDYGATWSTNTRIDHAPGGFHATRPVLAVDGGDNAFVAWHDYRDDDWDICLTRNSEHPAISGLAITTEAEVLEGASTTMSATVASGTGLYLTWDLGDGHDAVGWVVTHTYASAGSTPVVVTATNGMMTSTATLNVDVLADGAPAAVTDLVAEPDPNTPGGIALAWSAPDDDGGAAALYDVRTYSQPITPANWAGASPVSGEPAPRAPGGVEHLTLPSQGTGDRVYVALKSRDAGGQWSVLSNLASVLDTGFRPMPDGYSFANYTGTLGSDYTLADMADMFGVANVCYSSGGLCLAYRPTARVFNYAMHESIKKGHCEGMAVTSLRFFAGLDEVAWFDAGAADVFSLDKDDVRRQIAWYYMLQMADPVKAAKFASRQQTPAEVLTALDAVMEADAQGPATLFVRHPAGGGHALAPYAMATRPGGETWIWFYDSNDPGDSDRHLTLDAAANTYDYAGVYTGTAGSHTLGIVPVQTYGQTPVCPWCSTGAASRLSGLAGRTAATQTLMMATGDGRLLITDAHGRRIGYDGDTFVNEVPGAYAVDVAAGFGVRTEPLYTLPLTETYTTQVTGLGTTRAAIDAGDPVSVTQVGPGFAIAISGLGRGATGDRVSLGAGGTSVAVAAGGTTVSKITLARDTGHEGATYDLSGLVLGSGAALTVTLDAADGAAQGALRLDNGAGATTAYTLTLTAADAAGETTTAHADIALDAGATHVVDTAAWDATGELTVEIDADGDGKVDETVVLAEPNAWTVYLPLVLR